MYSDDYPTCAETFATFRLYSVDLEPSKITRQLGIQPSEVHRKGKLLGERRLEHNGWFLSSNGRVKSRDNRRHLDWLLDELESAKASLEELRATGAKMDISCYWLSAHGHGGPVLSPHQTSRLADLCLDCSFDVYCLEE